MNLKAVELLIRDHLHREPIIYIVVEEPLKFYWLQGHENTWLGLSLKIYLPGNHEITIIGAQELVAVLPINYQAVIISYISNTAAILKS